MCCPTDLFERTELDLSFEAMDATTFSTFTNAVAQGVLPRLTKLNLRGNLIGAEGAGRLAAVLVQCPSLANLDLCSNDIGAEGAAALFEALKVPSGSLGTLDLRGE